MADWAADAGPVSEVSIGDYVLAGGESAVLVMVEAVTRLLPGVVGNRESVEFDSHADGLLEGPSYTRPATWRGHEVPPVLLSGDHAAIARWRRAESLRRTAARRPDLLAALPRRRADRRRADRRSTRMADAPAGPAGRAGARARPRRAGCCCSARGWPTSATPPGAVLYWYTPGGQVEPGERCAQAAARELVEEIGLAVDPAALEGPVWLRRAVAPLLGVDDGPPGDLLRAAGRRPRGRRQRADRDRGATRTSRTAGGAPRRSAGSGETFVPDRARRARCEQLLAGPWTGPPRIVS